MNDAGIRRPKLKKEPVQSSAASLSLATALMMTGLMLSKITGQLREILIVPTFGYGIVSDAYIIGFQVPDLFYQLLVGGAIQAAITPTLAAAIARRRPKEGWRSVSILINVAAVSMIVAVLVGQLLAPLLIAAYNRGKEPEIIELATQVTRALFPQTFFMMMAALCIGVLNAYKKFTSTAFGPSLYNLCVVAAMLLLGQASPHGAVRVASGVLLAAVVYFLFQLVPARRPLQNYVFSFDLQDKGFRRLLRLAVPTLISGSIIQLNTIILTSFARQFPGAVTSLRQAATTWQLPYGVIVVAIGNVMLPSLAGYFATRDKAGCQKLLTSSLRSALYLMLPAAGLFLVMRADVIRGIFQWGPSYSEEAVMATASILRWYCLAMVAQTFVFLINQAFFARRMTKIALYNGLLTLVLNTLFCFGLTQIPALGVSALSLAYALTSFISAAILYRLYGYMDPAAKPRSLFPFFLRAFTALIALLLLVMLLSFLPIEPQTKIMQLVWLFLRSALGFAAYLGVSLAIGMREPRLFLTKVKNKLARVRR